MLRSYEKLIVWKEADDLCVFTHKVTGKLPSTERYGLIAQMRSSSSSIPTNIVEGNSRRTANDRAHFMTIAFGSLDELHYQYHLCCRLGYIDEKIRDEAFDRIQRVGYLLGKFRIAILSQ